MTDPVTHQGECGACSRRRPEPGEVYEWTDSNDLNQFQWRRLESGSFLVILGHGPHDHRRTFVSVVLPEEVASDFAAALVEELSDPQFGSRVSPGGES